jgi:hypothetical protein
VLPTATEPNAIDGGLTVSVAPPDVELLGLAVTPAQLANPIIATRTKMQHGTCRAKVSATRGEVQFNLGFAIALGRLEFGIHRILN